MKRINGYLWISCKQAKCVLRGAFDIKDNFGVLRMIYEKNIKISYAALTAGLRDGLKIVREMRILLQ
jgi:hypothetical protein